MRVFPGKVFVLAFLGAGAFAFLAFAAGLVWWMGAILGVFIGALAYHTRLF